MSKFEYAEYLKSTHWSQLRSYVMVRDLKCRICEELPPTQVHHMEYRNIYDVAPIHLIGLCSGCHTRIHKCKAGRMRDLETIKWFLANQHKTFVITLDVIEKLESRSRLVQLLAKGVLKVAKLNSAIGKKVKLTTWGKVQKLMQSTMSAPKGKRTKSGQVRAKSQHY